MPSEIDFVKHQSREFFNVHKPTPQLFADNYVQYNQKSNPMPLDEQNRYSTGDVQKTKQTMSSLVLVSITSTLQLELIQQ